MFTLAKLPVLLKAMAAVHGVSKLYAAGKPASNDM